jgi:hypothetical protein
MSDGLFIHFRNRIFAANDYPTLIKIFTEMDNLKIFGELEPLQWWNLYNLISPKLQKAFKQTPTGKLMNDLLDMKPDQILGLIPKNTAISFPEQKEREA